jgi:hypothetical protein
VSFSVLHGSYYNINTSLNRYGVKGVILTSSLTDYFPVFGLFFTGQAAYYQIMAAVEPAITYDLFEISSDLEDIANRLSDTNPFIKDMINRGSPAMDAVRMSMSTHAMGGNYHGCQLDYLRLVTLRIDFLDRLTIYMTSEELQMLDVSKETLANCTREFRCLHGPTVPSAEDLEKLRGSNLMREVNRLIANRPFNR